MIVEGFEIENWSCIRRLAIADLPATGVVVLHGPNGTGKSSIVAALRAALLDYAPTSRHADLQRWVPKLGGETPRVRVVFRVAGRSYRVTKQFKSSKSDSCLEERAATGWSVLTKTPSEVHERTQELLGCKSSDAGLYQLLWLPQAHLDLPASKEFDGTVQAALRRILGVMQTARDDRFIGRVSELRSQWYGLKSKSVKESSDLAKNLKSLKAQQTTLDALEDDYRKVEQIERIIRDREQNEAELRRQSRDLLGEIEQLRLRHEQTQARRAAWEEAGRHVAEAEASLAQAKQRVADRARTQTDLEEAERDEASACSAMKHAAAALAEGKDQIARAEQQCAEREAESAQLADRLEQAEAHTRLNQLDDRIADRAEVLARAEQLADQVTQHRQRAASEPAPTDSELKMIIKNRRQFDTLTSQRSAVAIGLTIELEPGQSARVSLDGQEPQAVTGLTEFQVARHAELHWPGIGRAVIRRGSETGSIEEIDRQLRSLEREFVEAVAQYGLPIDDPHNVVNELQTRRARVDAEAPRVRQDADELARLAPDGLDALRDALATLRRQRETTPTPAGPVEDASTIRSAKADVDQRLKRAKQALAQARLAVDREPDGLTAAASSATGAHLLANAKLQRLREDLARFAPADELAQAVASAQQQYDSAASARDAAALTEAELLIADQLRAAEETQRDLDRQVGEHQLEVAGLKGQLREKAGLHPRRAEAAARVRFLQQRIAHDQLDADAYLMLHELFEQCKDRQVATVLEPITRRVLRWVKLAGIAGYGDLTYGDSFLPTHLVGRDGAATFSLDQESTGTREQLAMMVRLALGSVLAGDAGEPATAILDDPLTHSDLARLTQMRAILKSAADGDPAAMPPAGPLQILVFTCRRDWFSAGAAQTIDLARSEVLERGR